MQFTNFGIFEFFVFQNYRYWLTLIKKNYHGNFSKTTFTYKILNEITLTHTGWA